MLRFDSVMQFWNGKILREAAFEEGKFICNDCFHEEHAYYCGKSSRQIFKSKLTKVAPIEKKYANCKHCTCGDTKKRKWGIKFPTLHEAKKVFCEIVDDEDWFTSQ